MLGIGKIEAGKTKYLADAVARGQEDYYTGSGEAPGAWCGRGAAALSLSGEVTEQQLERLLAGKHPETGKALRSTEASIPGFDGTFKAPKSVSVAWALADQRTRQAIQQAHDAAVQDGRAYLESEACHVRRGHAGSRREPGVGFVAATFRHRTSRAGDPHLHTHVVIANMARGPDGRWTSIVHPEIYAEARAAGHIYQASLRRSLTSLLGIEWSGVTEGYAEIEGVDPALCDHFSKRREEIVEHMAERGEHGARAAQTATLATRRPKAGHAERTTWSPDAADYGVVPAGVTTLQDRWTAEAREAGLAFDEQAILRHTEVPAFDADAEAAVIARLLGPSGLTELRAAFRRRDVVVAVAQHVPPGSLTAPEVLDLADRVLAHANVLVLDHAAKGVDQGAWYTTSEMLSAESAVLRTATERAGAGVAQVPAEAVDAIIGGKGLSEEQAAMVRHLTGSGAGIDVVVGRGGSGKTHALGAAREAWERAGTPVLGCSLAARAAHVLQAESGIESTTIASVLQTLQRCEALPPGTVLVVDEAGMAGTRALARLARATAEVDGKLVLVGDHKQLASIEAGGIYRRLAEKDTAIRLLANRRQIDPAEREALSELRHGDPEKYVTWALDNDRIVTGESHDAILARMADDWAQVVESGSDLPLVLARRRADVAALNALCRERARTLGRLGADEMLAADGRVYAVGDRIVCLRNRHDIGITNGTVGTVAVLDRAAGALYITTDDGRIVQLDRDYIGAGHADYGYSITGHKSQGQTTTATLVLADDVMSREWAYVAASRAEESTRWYVVDCPDPESERHLQADNRSAVDRLLEAMSGSEAATAATARLRSPGIDRLGRIRDLAALPDLAEREAALESSLAPALARLSRSQQAQVDRLAEAETEYRDAVEAAQRAPKSAPARLGVDVARQRLEAARERVATATGRDAEREAWLTEHLAEVGELGEIRAARLRRASAEARALAAAGEAVEGLGVCPESRRERRAWLRRVAAERLAAERLAAEREQREQFDENEHAMTQ